MSDEVPPGLGDDTAAEKAMSDLVQWARQEELLGKNVLGQIAPTLQSLFEGTYKRAQQRCANQHDLTQISKIITIDRREQLISLNLHTVPDDLKCARFRLDFDSTVIITPGGSQTGSWTYEYVAHPTLTFLDIQRGGGPIFSGATTGSYAKAQGTVSSGPSWTAVASGTGATFAVDSFCLGVLNTGCASQSSVLFDIGMPTETLVDNNGHQSPPVP